MQTKYGKESVIGSFTPLYQFADERHIKYGNEEELCDLIAAKYPNYSIGFDK